MTLTQNFTHTHYVPILKGKLGEFNALKTLYQQDKAALTPLIEVVQVDWDYDEDAPKKSEADHLLATRDKMVKSWGTTRPLFVDLGAADLSAVTIGDTQQRHPYTFFFDIARAAGLLAIPVIPLSPDLATLAAVQQICAVDRRGVMVRIERDHIIGSLLTSMLAALPRVLGLAPGQIDIVLDLEEMTSSAQAGHLMGLPYLLPNLPHLHAWRTFTLAGCAFPENLSGFAIGTIDTIPRVEWQLWTGLIGRLPQDARVPTFSDYAVAAVDLPDVDMRFVDPRNNIRYTTTNDWLLVRGQSNKRKRGLTNPQLCSLLMGHPAFCGAAFSEGDKYIVGCATGQTGPGNMTTWRQVGTNHHLTFVVRQIANLFVPSAPAAPGPVVGQGGGTP